MFTYEEETRTAPGKIVRVRVVESPHYTSHAEQINRLLLHALDTQEQQLIALSQIHCNEWRILLTRYGAIARVNNLRSIGQEKEASELFAIYRPSR